jgi:TP901-1 family phage major tail protein
MSIKGSAVVLKKGTTSSGTTQAAMRTVSFSLNAETVDVTSADDSNRWRQLLAAAGVKSMSITMSGVLKDVATHDQMIDDFVAQTSDNYGLVVGSLGTFNGAFQLTQFEGSGEYNAEAQFTITLESAGDITYAAVA